MARVNVRVFFAVARFADKFLRAYIIDDSVLGDLDLDFTNDFHH
jgi:hypothetical protein